MKKALSKHKRTHATIMYIPENESCIRSLRIPVWFPRVITAAVAVLAIVSLVSGFMLNSLNLKYSISSQDIEALTKINNRQKVEIDRLKEGAAEIQRQLEENFKALQEVKKAVGIEEKEDNSTETSPQSSTIDSAPAGSTLTALYTVSTVAVEGSAIKSNDKYNDMAADISYMKTYHVSLLSEVKLQKEAIEKSSVSINKQVIKMSTIPSIRPVEGRISAGFGYRKNPFTNRGKEFHKGMDFAAPYGTNVAVTADGTVLFASWQSGYGRLAVVAHGNGISTLYAHNSKLLVKKGDKVTKGQIIAKVGSTGRSTGPHLHYEVKVNGKSVDPSNYIK